MNHDTPTTGELLRELEEIRASFKEHETEHKMLSKRILTTLLAGITLAIGYGVWVGEVSTTVDGLRKDVDKAATKVELTAAVVNIETKIGNITDGMKRLENGQETILDKLDRIK